MGLAYEIVINSNPCIAYLMEENTMCMQTLVMAHAAYGHNAFFKGNELFRKWTDADSIIDYLIFAKNYVRECESKYGEEKVEDLLDSCHSLMNFGIDQYKRPEPLSVHEEQEKQKEREQYLASQVNEFWLRTVPQAPGTNDEGYEPFPKEPEENILYFIEKNAPNLEVWEREIIRIVRKMSQYFYPQRLTRLMNEGFATFCHYEIMMEMWERGYISERFIFEFLRSHTAVTFQPPFHHPQYNGINVYSLGFAIYRDIKRICENPTAEDREWFPNLAGKDWREEIDFAMRSFRDDSFISQYLSPKVIRDFHLFAVTDDTQNEFVKIADIHDEIGYKSVRRTLSNSYSFSSSVPHIVVDNVDIKGDRSLTLIHHLRDRKTLEQKPAIETLKHVRKLWGFKTTLMSIDEDDDTVEHHTVE
jgi:spore cortex formation protein SpoVR/YcgB (stage V sporulation)